MNRDPISLAPFHKKINFIVSQILFYFYFLPKAKWVVVNESSVQARHVAPQDCRRRLLRVAWMLLRLDPRGPTSFHVDPTRKLNLVKPPGHSRWDRRFGLLEDRTRHLASPERMIRVNRRDGVQVEKDSFDVNFPFIFLQKE